MAITLRQAAKATVGSGGSTGNTITITFGENTAVGNCIVVCYASYLTAASVTGITIGGNADNFAYLTGDDTIGNCYIWADPNLQTASETVVITASEATTAVAWAYEFTGVATAGILDQFSAQGNSGSQTTFTSGATPTTTNANEVWVGIGASTSPGGVSTISGPASLWTNEASQTVSNANPTELICGVSGYQIVSSEGTATYSGTLGTSGVYEAAVVALLPTGFGKTSSPSMTQFNPGPTWLALFKPGLPKPQALTQPYFSNLIMCSGAIAMAPLAYSEVTASIVTTDMPVINPGPTWLSYFKPYWKINRPAVSQPVSGPYFGNQPNTSDVAQFNPGPTWWDHYKPGFPKPRPQNLPTGAGFLSGSIAMAPMAISGTATVYPTASGSIQMAPMKITGTGQVPVIASGSLAMAPMAYAGTYVHVPVITSGSVAMAPMGIVTPASGRDFHIFKPGPTWLSWFKPGLNKILKVPGGPQFISSSGSVAMAPMGYANTNVIQYLPFPQFPLNLLYEILINGTWTNISQFVYQRDPQTITRGLPDETQSATPSQMTLTLNNRDGRFSPNNPAGAYYPYLTRNVQLRCSVVNQASASGVPYSGYRFWGEVSSWPPRWDNTQSDIYCQIIVSGPLRRFVQGAKLGSTLYQYYTTLTNQYTPYAYWPAEDGSGATEIASALPAVTSMTFTGAPQFSSNASFGGSDPLPVIASSTWNGQTLAAEDPPGAGSISVASPGTYYWICPPGVTAVTGVVCIGAGGGGGDQNTTIGGGGGGGGGIGKSSSVGVTAGTKYTYVVGAGGAPGSATGGVAGSNSTFTGDTQTVTGYGGAGGNFGGSGGSGGAGSTYNGGTGGPGEAAESGGGTYGQNQSISGNSGASGGGAAGGTTSTSWTAPAGITGTVSITAQAAGGGGAGGGSGAAGYGGGGGAAGGYSTGTTSVSEGDSLTFYAGNGGAGGSAAHGGVGGDSYVSDGSVHAYGGGAGSGSGTGGSGGAGNVPGGSGGHTVAPGGGEMSGGGGGGGANGGGTGSNGGVGLSRQPGAGAGSGGGGGWGATSNGGSGATTGATGGGGGGGGGGGSVTNTTGKVGGGGGAGSISWSWEIDSSFSNDAQGGGGGSSAGTSTGGNAGGISTGGSAPAGGGAGGSTGSTPAGSSPGGGGAGGVPTGMSTSASTPGAGAAGNVAFSWSGGAVSPVAADIIRFCLDVDSAGAANGAVLLQAVTYGTVQTLNLQYNSGGTGGLELIGLSASNTTLFDSGNIASTINGQPLYVDIELTQNGTGATWLIQGIIPGAATPLFSATGNISSVSVGNVSEVNVDPAGAITDNATSLGQITVQTYADTIENLSPIVAGYAGETAAARMERLCLAQGINFTLEGNYSDTPLMGPQQDDTFVNVMQSCADFDRGQWFETRSQFGFGYRTRVNMQGNSPVLLANYAAGVLAGDLEPTADDQFTRNSIVVTRNGGASATAQLTSGIMSILTPPNGVGLYSYSLTVYGYSDSQLANLVAWMLTVGTVSEYRYPEITFDMTRTEVESLFTTIPTMDIGDYIQVYNQPVFLQNMPINQLYWGVTETLNAYMWTISINTVPESPYSEGNPPTW